MASAILPSSLCQTALSARYLSEFAREAWYVLEPDTPLSWNWHHDMICDHLEAVSKGQITDLLINVPPGCTKSLLVSVMFNAWEWATRPEMRYLCTSYDQTLSTRDNTNVRDLVTSDWYQAQWPHVQLRHDQNQKTRFDTTLGGWRLGTSIGGRGTGEHPHRKLLDDPHNAEKALTDADRDRVASYYSNTLSSRGAALHAATIIIMQRLHEGDLSGYVLEEGGFEHIVLPMRFETGRMGKTSIGWRDPRKKPGELLWPEFFSEATVGSLERRLGSRASSGQLQQDPKLGTAGTFQASWFKFIPAMPNDVVRTVRAWDIAGTEGGSGARTAGVRMSITRGRDFIIDGIVAGRYAAPGVNSLIVQTAALDGRGVSIREENEGGSSGPAIIAARTKTLVGYDYKGIKLHDSKDLRADPCAVQAEAGNVYILLGPDEPKDSEYRQHVRELLDEASGFPNAKLKDLVDAMAHAFNDLTSGAGPVIVRNAFTGARM